MSLLGNPRRNARKRVPPATRRRALELLAASPDGCTEVLMRNFNSAVSLQVKCELPLTMGGFQMATEIGAVQSVSMMSGDLGWGFHLMGLHLPPLDHRGRRESCARENRGCDG
jgi:hypothetical protein